MSNKVAVGEVRPSQLMFNYGVGAIVDLPKLSVIVMGLEDWPTERPHTRVIEEERLLHAVRYRWPSVQQFLTPPLVTEEPTRPQDPLSRIGVPVAAFPRWMVCPVCNTLAPVSDGFFRLATSARSMDQLGYRHESCRKAEKPTVVPAHFLVACESGHLDDFPWIEYVHQGKPCPKPQLSLLEYGPSGEARDLVVRCERCDLQRGLADAFDPNKRAELPLCRGRRPHLRDWEEGGCTHLMRPILLGASNTWFPTVISSLAIPAGNDGLAKLVEEGWATLADVEEVTDLAFLRRKGQLGALVGYSDPEIWGAIQAHRAPTTPPTEGPPDLKLPEWQIFTRADSALNGPDFRLTPVAVPTRFAPQIQQVIQVERLREVRAMLGFTRVDAMGELTDPELGLDVQPAPLTRQPPLWVPASEVRGEGIFLRFQEKHLTRWLDRPAVQERAARFLDAHRAWRAARGLEPDERFPGMRYVLLHTFAHLLMREMALECGYGAASIRERIYARPPEAEGGPMAGILLYTAAPDSEGTLGGLVRLGAPETLERLIAQALEGALLCANDPLCAEHPPSQSGRTLHAVACHACAFAPETSCERGNKYLDRALLVATVEQADMAFFE